MIFVESSPRYISPERVKEIVAQLPPFVNLVGVFVNGDPVEIEEIVDYCGLTHVQLHGDEDGDYCQKLAQYNDLAELFKIVEIIRDNEHDGRSSNADKKGELADVQTP